MTSLEKSSVLITGGAGGLGIAFAEKLLSLGCKVCLGDSNTEAGEKTQEKLASKFGQENVIFVTCDVTSDKSFRELFDSCERKFGSIDVVINNAGVGNEKDFKITMEVNLGGCIRGTELALEYMGKDRDKNGGKVVNVSSMAGINVHPFGPFYSASKSGIIQYSKTIGHPFHFNYTQVTVMSLCPSLVDTSFIQISPTIVYNKQCEAALKGLFGKIPLLKPEEVSDALIQMLEDPRPGGVMAVEKGKAPYYVVAPATS